MHLKLMNIGPIKEADIRFGDLTVFVGPQATGKSIALQFLKLILDNGNAKEVMREHELVWRTWPRFCDGYFGEGMRSIWTEGSSKVKKNGAFIDLEKLVDRRKGGDAQSLFYIPAQRVLTMRDGWPLRFRDFSSDVPFVVRDFSEWLWRLLDRQFDDDHTIFSQHTPIGGEFRKLVEKHVFGQFDVHVEDRRGYKRLVLGGKHTELPFMAWSAGQREFVPLLLGLYRFMPTLSSVRRTRPQWIVIEEPEMGLHPRAITVVLLMILHLVANEFRVCVSTHSSHVIDAIWALQHLKQAGATPEAVLDLFEAPRTLKKLAKQVLRKKLAVYYFDSVSHRTRDISTLDPDQEEAGESGWGGLSEFSGRANEAVARAIANSQGTHS